jgi:zinc transport system permease protein
MDQIFTILYRLFDILLPFEWAKPMFMRHAFLALLVVSPLSAMLGVHVTSFRMAFFSDAIAHSAFTGIALGFLFSVNPILSMTIFALLIALTIIKIERASQLAMDSIISVIMSSSIAIGLAIVSYQKSFLRHFQQYLFGDILTVTRMEVIVLLVVLLAATVFIALSFNRLTLLALNPYVGINRYRRVEMDKIVFSFLVAIVVAVSIKMIGMLLITSMLVIPSAAARLIAQNIRQTFWYAVVFSFFASLAGLIVSYYADLSTGATIIILLSVIFLGSYVVKIVK